MGSTQTEVPFYRAYLNQELNRRIETNDKYSLRAFARDLGMDPGFLSRVLSQKMTLSPMNAKQVVEILKLPSRTKKEFFSSLAKERVRRELTAAGAPVENPSRDQISAEMFEIISDLHHYAILELTYTEDFQPNIEHVAERLGITKNEAKLAVQRLLACGLLKKTKSGWKDVYKDLQVSNKKATTAALKHQQRQILARALEALDRFPIEKRVANSVTLSVDPSQIELARKMISDFSYLLTQTLQQGRRKNVYQLHVNLFPLEREGV
jgi:uncharacterized protein (TIGR02147 family)